MDLIWVNIKGQSPEVFKSIKSAKEYIEKWTGKIVEPEQTRYGLINNGIPVEVYRGSEDAKKDKLLTRPDLRYLLATDPLYKNVGRSKMSYKEIFTTLRELITTEQEKVYRGITPDLEPLVRYAFLTHLENVGVHNGLKKHTKLYLVIKRVLAKAKS